MFTEPLPTLAELGTIDATAGGSATVRMINARHKFHTHLRPTPTFAYRSTGGQSYLGPVVVARRDIPFDLVVVNQLREHPLANAIDTGLVEAAIAEGLLSGAPDQDRSTPRAVLHLHGGNTAPEFDGGPLDTVENGTSFTYHYENAQAAAGLWYHDHALAITRLNVYAGLAGGYLIRDEDDPGDGSRLPADPYEVPLVIQDRMFTPDGRFAYPPNPNPTTPRPWSPEFFGNVATVNGKAWPRLTVARGKYRFRVYNGSNARFYNLRFLQGSSAHRFWQIGTDGGLLDAPVPLTVLLLGPGERADVIIDFAGLAPGTKLVLSNDAPTPYPDGPVTAEEGGVPLPEIMQFTVGSATGWTGPLPSSLLAQRITRLTPGDAATVRSMTLVERVDEDDAPLGAFLNNRAFGTTDYLTAPVTADTVEQWELVNTTGDAHPVHLHYTQFQILDRQAFDAEGYLAAVYGAEPLTPNTGPYPPPSATPFLTGPARPPAANEAGWKDTVVAMPGEVTRILVPFGANAAGGRPLAMGRTYQGEYVWHCHILEHEDNDMMQRYEVR
jgi:FtsP/CotA-like multicopper oxidase with cupredoxin domain